MRGAMTRGGELRRVVAGTGRGDAGLHCHGSFAMSSSDEAAGGGRFFARVGRDRVLATEFAGCVDGGTRARLCCDASGEMVVRGASSASGPDGEKRGDAVGCDADFVIWDADAKFRVEPAQLH